MHHLDIEAAARQLALARRTGRLLDRLDDALQPRTLDDAHAIQDATVVMLGDAVAGWKVAAPIDGRLARGILLRSRLFDSPACVPATLVPLLAVEAEIAFRFERDMPPREAEYGAAEVAAAVVAIAGIEIVDSRFRDYLAAPMLDKTADFVSNGAFIAGSAPANWRSFDLSTLEATLVIDGEVVVRKVGGHPTGDPIIRAVQLVNTLRSAGGVQAGQLVTTGTYTGLSYAKPGQTVVARFAGFGFAQVSFV
jgi:2-keto-4-pentenoate hydratase